MVPLAMPPRVRFTSSVTACYTYDPSALPDTPLCSIPECQRWRLVPRTAIGDSLGLKPGDISARALRAGGVMALLLGKVDYATIQLIGRWRSDQILRYLQVSARPIMQGHAHIIANNSAYRQFPTPTIDLLD
jgi:hypothetical protein